MIPLTGRGVRPKPTNHHMKMTLNKERAAHHAALETLRAPGVTTSGLRLWRTLRRFEGSARRAAEQYANGEIGTDHYERRAALTVEKVRQCLGRVPSGFIVNSDPRGYALKLDPQRCEIPEGLARDWGGYGILAAEIN